ncbi:ferredoxin [Cellulomonas sp. P24]|uniref:ferredoxin n=1 Tax=Cellulomonas sp. P24 TaxID=2885206 RepID=UPI00216B2793|nr:ferredoxin [Cellulomonas sp. P24]MCR6492590.1 ferredoxin [Cellulomonas sp. P24]
MKKHGETSRLRIDAAACDGIGVCAHLASEVLELDRWGFPIITARELSRSELSAARRAVRACPRKALWIETSEVPSAAERRPGGTAPFSS